MLSNGDLSALRARIGRTLQLFAESCRAIASGAPDLFDAASPVLRFISPLADGADQLAAEVALELGWELQAVLPFDEGSYRKTLTGADAQKRFDELVARASCVLRLPGDEADSLAAYVMTGRATVAHADILLAIWDGLPPRGRGGTGEIVQLALTSGTAIAHVPPGNDASDRLLWSAFDPKVLTLAEDSAVERPVTPETVDAMLRRLLLPPDDVQEQRFLAQFCTERLRRFRTRFEYPLLLAAAGVRRFSVRRVAGADYAKQVKEEWQRFRQSCAEPHEISAPDHLLEDAYSWADRLATHFAQTYRSGHIFNFTFGGLAVCLGLSAFMAPHLQFRLAAFEMVITVAIILNGTVGTRNEWHRRWLDYRQLAERLRPMRSLSLLGIAAPDPPGSRTNPVPRRWIEWYASGLWRALGCPAGALDADRAQCLAKAIAEHEVTPQVRYHLANADQIDLLDRRLNLVGTALFGATLAVSITTLFGLATDAAWVSDYGNWFTLVQAGFPALGTAIFGIRFQADFGGDAIRSRATAGVLKQIADELHRGVSLTRAADLAEQAARTMLADLDEWRLVNQQRDLDIG